jgi:hypothetical protein
VEKINMDNHTIQKAESSKYLGSNIVTNGIQKEEMTDRIKYTRKYS